MRPPEELDDVDWSALGHAYGPATDVPGWIRALYAEPDAVTESGEEVVGELITSINHQGSVYTSTLAAVPFLAHLAHYVDFQRSFGLFMITTFAEDDERESTNPLVLEIRAAARAEIPALAVHLGDESPEIRRYAIRLVHAAGRPAAPEHLRELADLCRHDPHDGVRADALTALAWLDPITDLPRELEAAALKDRSRKVRADAALLGLARVRPPYPADLLKVMAEDGGPEAGTDRYADDGPPFPYPAPPTHHLLVEDPEGALDVADAWIAAGDVHEQGSWLAHHVATTWRDQEPRTTAALLAALPHAESAISRRATLRYLRPWIVKAGDLGQPARDALFAAACSRDLETSAHAQQALAACGDLRVLDLRCASYDYYGPALATLLTHHRERARPLLLAAPPHLVGHPWVERLVTALDPELAAAWLPQLKAAFAERPGTFAEVLGSLPPGAADTETLNLLADAAGPTHGPLLRAIAAVSLALLTGDTQRALTVLPDLLHGRTIALALIQVGRLANLGVSLAPLVATFLDRGPAESSVRARAADAYWRIAGDPGPVLPTLIELAAPSITPKQPDGAYQRLPALRTLAAIGTAPPQLTGLLETCAHSTRRLNSYEDDEELRSLAQQLLGQGTASP